jgi:environmental stress-induced protein Ves
MARLITADRQARMPWRNGRGATREVAAWPPGATLDTFAWRVSVATIARSGPFSRFPGVARTLVLLSGTGVRLRGATTRIELARCLAAATLRGEEQVDCELGGSSVEMFNVMVRGDTPARIVTGDAAQALPDAEWRVCYAARGAVECAVGDARFDLSEGDAVILEHHETARIAPGTAGGIAVTALIDAAGIA